MTSQTKKLVKQAPSTKKTNVLHIDEGILDSNFFNRFRGGMTREQKAAYDKWIAEFLGRINNAIATGVKGGVVTLPTQRTTESLNSNKDTASLYKKHYEKLNTIFENIISEIEPTPTAGQAPTTDPGGALSISQFLYLRFIPKYVTSFKNMDQTLKNQTWSLCQRIQQNWATTGARKTEIEKLGALIYNFIKYSAPNTAPEQPNAPQTQSNNAPEQPNAPQAQQSNPTVTTGTGSFFNQLQASIDGGWNNLTRQQKRTLKSLIAGKPD